MDHFAGVNKTIKIPKGATKKIEDHFPGVRKKVGLGSCEWKNRDIETEKEFAI